MGWIELQPIRQVEADIQEYLARWPRPLAERRDAGAPAWLAAMREVTPQKYHKTALGYGFYPDLLATSGAERLVLELKCAPKGEPLALVEVLHHAWMLAHDAREGGAGEDGPARTPVLVTQYHNWLRASLAQLHLFGMRKNAIKFVEFTMLKAVKAGSETLIWFDEPFAEWERSEAPALPAGLVVRGVEWRRVEGAATWIALKEPMTERPPVWAVPYLMITAVPERNQILTWSGAPGELGRFLLWEPGRGNPAPEVVEL